MDERDDTGAMTAVTAADYRAFMAAFPSGVVIVTTVAASGDPLGLTCSSLCGVSLEPPLLLVCIANRSGTLAALRSSGLFAVNMLHQDGRDAARAFSTGTPGRFDSVLWVPTSRARLPSLPRDAHAVAECRVQTTVVAGDHTIVVGEVLSVERLAAAAPLMYGLRQYAVWPGGGAG
jgi:flavin reductase (DIM6/NTAB) family NADH-FMN oxidoreductase RutF